jgi:hypothetical protein
MASDVKIDLLVHQSGFMECDNSIVICIMPDVVGGLQFHKRNPAARLFIHHPDFEITSGFLGGDHDHGKCAKHESTNDFLNSVLHFGSIIIEI